MLLLKLHLITLDCNLDLCLYVYQPVPNMTADILNLTVLIERNRLCGMFNNTWLNLGHYLLVKYTEPSFALLLKETHSSFYVTVPLLSSQTSSCISVALHDDYTVWAKCYLYPLPKRAPFISAALSIQHLFCLIVSCSLSSLPCSCNMRSSISSVLGLPTNNRLINYTSRGHIHTQPCAPLKFRVTRAFPLISSKNCQPQLHPDLRAPVEGTVETV